jgi:hypothetical protein
VPALTVPNTSPIVPTLFVPRVLPPNPAVVIRGVNTPEVFKFITSAALLKLKLKLPVKTLLYSRFTQAVALIPNLILLKFPDPKAAWKEVNESVEVAPRGNKLNDVPLAVSIFGFVRLAPVLSTTLPVPVEVVVPVPPFKTGKAVPLKPIVIVPLTLNGDPVTLRKAGTAIPTEVRPVETVANSIAVPAKFVLNNCKLVPKVFNPVPPLVKGNAAPLNPKARVPLEVIGDPEIVINGGTLAETPVTKFKG